MTLARILVIEDDPGIRAGVVACLELEGYGAVAAGDAAGGLRAALHGKQDLILLDLVLPGGDGFDIVEELRRQGVATPVIILTARGSEPDRVRGLRLGADDYVVKPFGTAELLARVQAVLRRGGAPLRPPTTSVSVAETVIDLERREVRRAGRSVSLSEQETAVLALLTARRDGTVARAELQSHLARGGAVDRGSRAVDMLMVRLRTKLAEGLDPSAAELVRTVRGSGWQLGGV
jgi:two-component system copper resistance phosphate regulon response regulator CusR